MIITQIVTFLNPSYYQEFLNPEMFRPWSDPLMSLYFVYPFILAFALAWIWGKVKKIIPGKSIYNRGLNFGLSYFVIATIPGMFITLSSFQISFYMVMVWAITGLIGGIVLGLIFAKLNP